ncbi:MULTISPECIES: tRNA (adenosine(37)-N6)-threonylcarbamoyltransferase complex ATPase subunit type 1 TsaE [Paraburkholderia]|jgi:tRNA threonylcarbamoyladenosine biosynthesis protein TsaE|uniref:tRNA (adenosine(37)-N6)-threonylcarbamoyltransferase complex ATPase subunit type 1 TsaE n=1 Tax=Paraburkholderia TaxID=1822464 RepID=UPI001B20186F|nr:MULTISPECIES: tRNA (adenosine(37)-N6)-threonylcarbamoyltransferase complex ATPase subunit type 1 TsaE [Paraburkholderia]MCP2085475.1 tRNA threonylcarbamoyladenosine biosynthesis protein TsaE [Paraburkholderia sediminicola]MCX4153422.1 tRNA (adenosine(37)-N6)-threonylcarbamoyltransferase complex ATPase subunit type 1 TsaE [Paraburkholderia aspalathi]MDN7162836.1 tRNA (adenosine(37)-N6)-threonylcarbamoyltransferase complex ATPase subunit type 1 TsaE [Paraburkholderia sp. SECH2]MDQ6391322.1 tRN
MPVNPDLAIQPPADILLERSFALADEAATNAFGKRFAQAIESVRELQQTGQQHTPGVAGHQAFHGLQVQLVGDLGAGKTTLVRATLRGLGHVGRVRSPTYTLVEPYVLERPAGELALYHFDLYRFTDPAEWADAGFREYFDSGAICLVEWPQRAGRLLGVPDLVFALDLDHGGDGRILVARAYSESGKACLERC